MAQNEEKSTGAWRWSARQKTEVVQAYAKWGGPGEALEIAGSVRPATGRPYPLTWVCQRCKTPKFTQLGDGQFYALWGQADVAARPQDPRRGPPSVHSKGRLIKRPWCPINRTRYTRQTTDYTASRNQP